MRFPILCFVLCLGLVVAGNHGAVCAEYGSREEDEAFWAGDTLLTARVDSLGREVVVRETALALSEAIRAYSDTSIVIEHDTLEEWVQAIRWATILREETLIQSLEAITRLERRPDQMAAYYRFTYLARWGLYRIWSEERTAAQKVDMLMGDFFAEDQFAQIFAQDRIVELGHDALAPLIRYARDNIVPRMDELEKELTSEEDLKFVTDYLYFTGFLRGMVETDEDKSLFEALLEDPDPRTQTLALDVLEGLEDLPEEEPEEEME